MKGKYAVLPTDLAYKISEVVGEQVVFYRYLQYQDIVDSAITVNYLEENTLELTIRYEADLIELYNKAFNNTLIFERMIYQDDEMDTGTLPTSTYNNLFFGNLIENSKSRGNTKQETFFISGLDWKGYIEKRKIVEHTVFYNTLPVDPETGEPVEPDDFNKIKYNLPWEDIILDVYQRNIGFDTSTTTPVQRVKGNTPGVDLARKVDAHSSLTINNANFPPYKTLQEKKNILDFKIEAYKYFSSQDLPEVYTVETKILDDKIKVIYNPKSIISVDNLFSKDDYNSYKYSVNEVDTANDIVIESSQLDFDYRTANGRKGNEISTFELLDTGSNDDGDTDSLETLAVTRLEENRGTLETILDIEFADKTYFKDIMVGYFIELTNFDNFLNGTYYIKEIQEVFENNYITYTISDMEKIAEGLI